MTRAPYSGPWPPRRGYRLVVVARGLAALVGLALMTVGYPAALLVVAPRLHFGIPTADQIITALTRPDDGTLLLQTLAVIAWACWAVFIGCLLLELGCLARRAATPRLPALGWPQAVAASLIAAITVMLLPVTRATAAPTRPDIIATAVHTPTATDDLGTLDPPHPAHHRTRPPTTATRPGTTRAPDRAVIEITVQDGDTLWGLAERHLGYGTRYAEIADLNYGRPQPDGDTLTHRHWLTPGWRLLIPDDPPLPGHPATPHDTTHTASPAPSPGASRDTYVVQPHDTLWDIAQTCLGDGERYREIAVLNLRRPQPDGRALIDPDLIQPGWILHLPPATVHHSIHESTDQATGKAGPGDGPTSTPQRGATTPTPAATTTAPPGRSVTATPAAEPSVTTVAPTTAPTAPAPDTAADPTAVTVPGPTSGATAPTHTTDAEGIHLNGSFIPWTLASAITSTIALAWLQRRRRHVPGAVDDDPTDLPAPVLTIQRAAFANPDHRPAADLADRAADVPAQPQPPSGGVGLVGDGAAAAARAALISALSSGGPREPDHRAEVVTDRATLTRLLGEPAAALPAWPRLHLGQTTDEALGLVETQLLYRARVLDDNQVTDLATLRDQVPDAEPLPPLLLIAPAPQNGTRTRTLNVLTQGAAMGMTALLLGTWDDGVTLHITPDGHAGPATRDSIDATAPADIDGKIDGEEADRIAVLDADTAVALLTTLREAHTGLRVSASSDQGPNETATPAAAALPDNGHRAVGNGHVPAARPADTRETTAPRAQESVVKAQVRVLGVPDITNTTASGQPLRAKAAELAVFLACHPDGADIRTIGEYLESDHRLRESDQHVYTNVSNLRHVLGRAAGVRRNAYVIKKSGRYKLDPDTVDVDLWQLRQALAQAAESTDPHQRERLLRQACALTTAPLAATCEYDWIEPHREAARQQAVEARLHLADVLTDTAPPEAADILDQAIALDPYNEDLYRRAMTARHRTGDHDGIRRLHRALTRALAALDAEPEESTTELVSQLLAPTARS